MRLLSLLLLTLLAGSWSAAPDRGQIVITGPRWEWLNHMPLKDRIDPKSRECTEHRSELAAVAARDHLEIDDHRAFIDRALWEAGAKADWSVIAWGMAFMSSCNAGARGTHSITMFDRNESEHDPMKRMLAHARVSTKRECHGDHAMMGSDDIWYIC